MRQRTVVIAGGAVAIGVWACLPFSRTYTTSPPIVGVYRAETGEPLGGVLVAKSLQYNDSLCASAAVQTTTTDSAGAFYLPLTEDHLAVTVFAPIEQFLSYSVCARVAGVMRLAFTGGELSNSTPVSITCIESRTPNTKPVVCTKNE